MAAVALIGIAICAVLYGVAGVDLLTVFGAFLVIIGADLFLVGATYSSAPDKFGPSEQMCRVAVGLLVAVIGIAVILIGLDVNMWVAVAVVIVGIALIGLATGLINSKKSKF